MAKQKVSDLDATRHSLAHIMAASIQRLWSGAKFGVGPVIENGFYYDVDLGGYSLKPGDLPRIEVEMKGIIKANLPIERFELPMAEALEWAKSTDQPYKLELLKDLQTKGTTVVKDVSQETIGMAGSAAVSFYKLGDFDDLCRGPHVEKTGKVGAFKLHKISGAYWRGNENNPQLQRIYGIAFDTQAQVDNYFELLAEAEKRDHRKLGQELDLFVISDLVGRGLPLFTPKGTVLRDELNTLSQGLRAERGFQPVWSPHIGLRKLYETSGHWDKFGDELFLVKSQETNDEFVMKPMNCPHHQQIYASHPRSYRDLPLKLMETSTIYRDEKSGELHGLSRVRSATQDDSHVFCREDQIGSVVKELLEITKLFYEAIGMGLKVHLSFRDSQDKYIGDQKLWEEAQATLEKLSKENKLDFVIDEGEAAFYGPKIDMIAVDSLSREWQVATIQLDFVQPGRFELEYSPAEGGSQTPVMIHFALMGSIERFLALYIEHTGGRFPLWLAPEQVRLITVNETEEIAEYALDLKLKLQEAGLRCGADLSNESVGKKIRNSELMKIPYTIVIGAREVKSGKVTPRVRKDFSAHLKAAQSVSLENFIKTVQNEAKSHIRKSSL